jgi:MtN3 and saliva related transmembrane protein
MNHIAVLVLGYVSGVLTTFAGIPQVIRVVKTSSTQDLSYVALSMTTSGLVLWTAYGFLQHDNPMIVFNLLAFVIYGGILSLKIYIEFFKKKVNNVKYTELPSLQDCGERV